MLLLFPLQSSQAKFSFEARKHPIEVARQFIGQRELTGRNDGEAVEACLRAVGLGKGYSYCAAFVSLCIKNSSSTFRPLSAVAQKFIRKESIPAIDVARGTTKVDSNYVAVWKRGSTPYGHIAMIERWKKDSGNTIEGNTSSGEAGSQSDGNGFYRRKRKIEAYNYFRITHFTKVI